MLLLAQVLLFGSMPQTFLVLGKLSGVLICWVILTIFVP